ncbi:MAG: phage/plasmid primase, P4 family, partial [Candidatus Nanopelagicales bacterium]
PETSAEPAPAKVNLTEGEHRTVPLGRRMAREWLRGRFIYVNGLGWHAWDGRRWQPESTDRALASAADWAERWIVGLIQEKASAETIRSALRYRDVGMVRQLLEGARTDVELLTDAAAMDSHPGLLNVLNGVVDLRTGGLRPHDPALLLTKVARADYRPDAEHPDWTKALGALPADALDWVQVHLGSAATGETDRTGPVVFHRGDGGNGKTALLGTVKASLGDYGVLISDKLLSAPRDSHETVWMPLRGARLALLEELPEGHTLPINRVKKLSDTPEITARLIGRDPVTWLATHSLIVSTNYTPRVAETDHGTWRRLVMVPYPHTFTGPDCDHGLKRRLRGRAQQEAALAWLVAGARRWYAMGTGLPELPESMAAATDEWRAESDELARFLLERIEWTGDPEDRYPMTQLLEAFNDWLPRGSQRWSATLFGSRLRAHHVVKTRGCGVDRGRGNRLPMALAGAIAQGAQGLAGHLTPLLSMRDDQHNPAHPAQSTKTAPSETPVCRGCGLPMPFGDLNGDGCHPGCSEAS